MTKMVEILWEILEDKSIVACERVEAARLLLLMGGWEPQGEPDEDEKVAKLVDCAKRLAKEIRLIQLYTDRLDGAAEQARINEVVGNLEAALAALEDET